MLLRKTWRTIFLYKVQFISMIIMIIIGIGVFVGFNIEWKSIDYSAKKYFNDTEFADYRLYSDVGFTLEEYEKIKQTEGIDKATRWITIEANVLDKNNTLAINAADEDTLTTISVQKGAQYDENLEGIYLSDLYAEANNIDIGDEITLVYQGIKITQEVISLIKSSEYLVCVQDSNQIMPDYRNFGYAFVSPVMIEEALGFIYYNQINLHSDLKKEAIEEKMSEILGRTILVLSKDENMVYFSVEREVEQGKTMGYILPILFLLIAVLTMITTMNRISANEKTQIGTLKALGFKNRVILRHYTSYGLVIGLIGIILGIALGYGVAYFIINPDGMMGTYFDLPKWYLVMPWYCYLIVALILLLLVYISYLSIKKILKGTASDSLRPYTPKKMKKLVIEKTKFWSKLSFKTKWNLRDISRHKVRSLMTLIGVIGSMVLLVGGVGMKDTMDGYMKVLESTSENYNTRINIDNYASNDQALAIASTYDGDWLSSNSIQYDNEAITLDIYDLENNMIEFVNRKNKKITINDDGVYVCIRLADEGVKVGDKITFIPFDKSSSYTVTVAGVIRSTMTKNIVMTGNYAEEIGLDYHINAVFTQEEKSNIIDNESISSVYDRDYVIDSYDSFIEIMDSMIIIFVLGAVVLGTVVLYNLGVMSYVERYRELATLKVVGFKNKHIGRILISQNIWLTIVGMLVGLPLGYAVLKALLLSLGSDYELKLIVGPLTYSLSILVTFGVSLVVSILVSRKNHHINMVEALKGLE